MARTGNGTTDFIKAANVLSLTGGGGVQNLSFHAWFKSPNVPNTSTQQAIVNLGTAAGNTMFSSLYWSHPSFKQSATSRQQNATFVGDAMSGSLSANTWYSMGFQFAQPGILKAYLNGVNSSGGTACGNPPSEPNTIVSLLSSESGTAEFCNGTLAEVGVWNVALTSQQWTALSLGMSPLMVQPKNLIWYADLVNDLVGKFGGPLTASGTTQSTHPRMQWPGGDDWRRFKGPTPLALQNNVNFQSQMVGSILGFAFLNNNVNFQSLFEATIPFNNNVNFQSQFVPLGQLANNVNFASSFFPSQPIVQLKNDVNFRSKFVGDVGSLATGRFREHFYG
jgi:hypothetical protein